MPHTFFFLNWCLKYSNTHKYTYTYFKNIAVYVFSSKHRILLRHLDMNQTKLVFRYFQYHSAISNINYSDSSMLLLETISWCLCWHSGQTRASSVFWLIEGCCTGWWWSLGEAGWCGLCPSDEEAPLQSPWSSQILICHVQMPAASWHNFHPAIYAMKPQRNQLFLGQLCTDHWIALCIRIPIKEPNSFAQNIEI